MALQQVVMASIHYDSIKQGTFPALGFVCGCVCALFVPLSSVFSKPLKTTNVATYPAVAFFDVSGVQVFSIRSWYLLQCNNHCIASMIQGSRIT